MYLSIGYENVASFEDNFATRNDYYKLPYEILRLSKSKLYLTFAKIIITKYWLIFHLHKAKFEIKIKFLSIRHF